ncbi:exopolysaccharide biosynthesis polyprenyl glycosylphosphotransferase [bacterium]|nr:exopolysaccharide biosynthesis polyprenyl glycosylphosphotransferase [bacterium]
MVRGVSWWYLVVDGLIIEIAFLAAYGIRFTSGWIGAPLGAIPLNDWLVLTALSLPLWLLIIALHGLYYARLKQAFGAELGALTHAVAEGLVATIILTFAVRGLPDSRLALLIGIALAWFWLAGYRWLARCFLLRRPRAAVIGNSPVADYLRRKLAASSTRFDLAGAFDHAAAFNPADIDVVFCDDAQAQALLLALPENPSALDVYILPAGDAISTAGVSVATMEGIPTLAVKSSADLAVMRRIKRAVDIIGALVLFALTSPFWLVCLLGIGLTMPGPVFFSHKRLGLFGRTFRLLKFRSMVKDAHKISVDLAEFDDKYKLKNDPRITAFGRLLRKLSLDELPQLINILKGDLSLVGPRPIVEDEVAKYGPWGRLLLTVPPGLTGLWQVSGRSDTTYQERVDFDLYYINNWSLGLDLLILLRTIPAVLSRKGAY